MSKRHYTIFLLSDDSSKTKQYKIPIKRFKLARNALVVFFLVVAYICVDYGSMLVRMHDYGKVKDENVAQKIELNAFSKKINGLEQQVAKLQIFDKKLRVLANLEVHEAPDARAMGMGGVSIEDPAPSGLIDKRQELVEQMHTDLDALEAKTSVQEKSFTELETVLGEQSSLLASTPSIWPVRGWVSSGYGKRRSPFTGMMERHTGIDIANRMGTPIMATANGRVVYAGRRSALGRTVVISHGYGIKSTYGHLSKILVKKGQRVERGDTIANMGSTGRSTGPHLHYDLAVNGVSVNPMKYILN